MSHTPGEWKYRDDLPDGTITVEIPGGHSIGYELEGSCSECFDNMRLIAAAPDLLEACHSTHAVLMKYGDENNWPEDIVNAVKQLRTAIEKGGE